MPHLLGELDQNLARFTGLDCNNHLLLGVAMRIFLDLSCQSEVDPVLMLHAGGNVVQGLQVEEESIWCLVEGQKVLAVLLLREAPDFVEIQRNPIDTLLNWVQDLKRSHPVVPAIEVNKQLDQTSSRLIKGNLIDDFQGIVFVSIDLTVSKLFNFSETIETLHFLIGEHVQGIHLILLDSAEAYLLLEFFNLWFEGDSFCSGLGDGFFGESFGILAAPLLPHHKLGNMLRNILFFIWFDGLFFSLGLYFLFFQIRPLLGLLLLFDRRLIKRSGNRVNFRVGTPQQGLFKHLFRRNDLVEVLQAFSTTFQRYQILFLVISHHPKANSLFDIRAFF